MSRERGSLLPHTPHEFLIVLFARTFHCGGCVERCLNAIDHKASSLADHACELLGLWREFDLTGDHGETQLRPGAEVKFLSNLPGQNQSA